VNKKGHPDTLVASHPGNANSIKHGVHSPRMIEPRAAEIEAELIESFELSPVYRLAAHEVAHNMAVLDAIDNYLNEQGLTDRKGKPRYLLEQRARTSRQLGYWLEKLSPELERQRAAAQSEEEVTSLSPEGGIKRLCELAVSAVEIDAFAEFPEIAQALEAQLVARGWAPPRRELSPEPIDPRSPDHILEGRDESGNSSEGDDGDEEDTPTLTALHGEGAPPPSAEPELPPDTVPARVPPDRPQRRSQQREH
jgi:hypothetical protein